MIVCTFPVSMLFCIRIVQEYERAVLFRLGRVQKNGTVGPGLFFIMPCMDQVIISLRRHNSNFFSLFEFPTLIKRELATIPYTQVGKGSSEGKIVQQILTSKFALGMFL